MMVDIKRGKIKMGIDGIMYDGPVADALAGLVTGVMAFKEFKRDIYK